MIEETDQDLDRIRIHFICIACMTGQKLNSGYYRDCIIISIFSIQGLVESTVIVDCTFSDVPYRIEKISMQCW